MAYLTRSQARSAATVTLLVESARTSLRKSASAPMTATFDIFLSHSYEDAELILGVKNLLEARRLRVYVDWVEDNKLDRTAVNANTAEIVRQRMRRSSYLLFATTTNSSQSRWMPWELGYFDGHKPGKVGILPLLERSGDIFAGQEYLGLYPVVEVASIPGAAPRFEVRGAAGSSNQDLRQLISA